MNSLNEATVLVVDDEPDLCDMLAFEFRLQGSRVLSARDGDGAYEVLQSQEVDAVVTDIQMANGTGIELLDRIREHHANEPSVVFITAYDTALAPIDAYDRGAEAIFGKPFRLKDLIERVQRVLMEPQIRWAAAPEQAPIWTVALHYASIEEARQQGRLEMGRGGIALRIDEHVCRRGELEPGCAVGIDLAFSTGAVAAVAGTGTLRWILEEEGRATSCGIEFEYLSDDCRQGVLEWLAGNPCRPYIPRLG